VLTATLVLALGAVAASCSPPQIESRVAGSIRLDPTHRTWSRLFEFSANEAALRSGGDIGVGLGFQSQWSEGAHEGPDVIATLSPIGGVSPSPGSATYDDRGCSGPGCIGRYEIEFRWLPVLKTGHVDIDWNVEGSVVFADGPVDDEAEVSVVAAG